MLVLPNNQHEQGRVRVRLNFLTGTTEVHMLLAVTYQGSILL